MEDFVINIISSDPRLMQINFAVSDECMDTTIIT